MATLKELLPHPKSATTGVYDFSSEPWFKDRFIDPAKSSINSASKAKSISPYGKRAGFVPRKPEDFRDGVAFPEIYIA
ncbi:hypothetical protein AMTR_s00147p00080840 [Amborella trichopoda]|uniref:Uncharacterized protein n=1 Tax=Amborella trichopoda TaxID=13333 RepID=W1P9L2_AMBTC|nr:hypothetical protein AMTR_s00147p00080840 [Amborella trichopoda]